MELRKLERRYYGGKKSVSIKCQNLHSFKEGLILLCQSILETRRMIHLHGSAHFRIPLRIERNLFRGMIDRTSCSCTLEVSSQMMVVEHNQ